MTLNTSADNLFLEITAAERYRDSYLENFDAQVERYRGPYYKEDRGDEQFFRENHYYEFCSLVTPRVVFDNPRVRVTTRMPGVQAVVAEAMKHGLNRWVKDTNFRQTVQRTATDMMFCWGVTLTSQGPGPIMPNGQPSRWPQVTRISQKRYFEDPLAIERGGLRFQGHAWIIDRDDLLELAKADQKLPEEEREGWNLKNIEGLGDAAVGAGLDDYRTADQENIALERKEIVLYDIWIPEAEEEDHPGEAEGYHGSIYTLAVARNQSGDQGESPKYDFVRGPRPFYGPQTGPYTVWGVYQVPDETYPLAPLAAMDGQIQDVNDQARAISNSASRYKRTIFYDGAQGSYGQAIKNAKDAMVVPIPNFDPSRAKEMEYGGVTAQEIAAFQIAKQRLDRNSGLTEAQRGLVSGTGTATENAIADEASSARMGFIKQQVADSAQDVLEKVGWYLYHDDRVFFPLGSEAAQALGMAPEEDLMFIGGRHEEGSGATFEDLELEIEPYSMERTDEGLQQRRMTEMMNFAANIAPLMPQAPWVRWKALLDKAGEAINVPDFGEIVDVDMVMQMAQAGVGEPDPKANAPHFGRQLGASGAARLPRLGGGGGSGPSPGGQNALTGLPGNATGAVAGMDRRAG